MFICCSEPYTIRDNGTTISVSEDSPFEIVLEGDANSPFAWELDTKPQFTKLEQPVTKTFNGTMDAYGFNFKAVSEGEDMIRITYTDGNDIRNTFEIKVIIGEMGLIESE